MLIDDPMTYRNSEMKLDELVSYFSNSKINLIPPFQRKRVWTLSLRQKLLENIVKGKPIPAIFLYKEEDGSKYSYNILDGKQRLESILLFIGESRHDVSIKNWRSYFFKGHPNVHFPVTVKSEDGKLRKLKFDQLDDTMVRNLREYRIPTIEIDMSTTEDGGLNEVIDLFIDINQYGVKVTRFDIVKTMSGRSKLLSDVFKIVGQKQERKKDTFYKLISNDFTFVLKRLQIMNSIPGERSQERVDLAWEKLLEIVLFLRSGQHRTLAQILKAFVGGKEPHNQISGAERIKLKNLFKLVKSLYSNPEVAQSKMATDQPYFYTMITSLCSVPDANSENTELMRKLTDMAALIDGRVKPQRSMTEALKTYIDLSSKQTTHVGRRKARQDKFLEILNAL